MKVATKLGGSGKLHPLEHAFPLLRHGPGRAQPPTFLIDRATAITILASQCCGLQTPIQTRTRSQTRHRGAQLHVELDEGDGGVRGGAPTAFIPIPRWPPTTIPRSATSANGSSRSLLPPAAADGKDEDALAAIRQRPTAARVAARPRSAILAPRPAPPASRRARFPIWQRWCPNTFV